MKAYKLLKVRKDKTIGPLFINCRQRIPLGVWLLSENHPTKGFAVRPGWHTCSTPDAPHLIIRGRAWFEVLIKDYQIIERPKSQGGIWYISNHIKLVRALDKAEYGICFEDLKKGI